MPLILFFTSLYVIFPYINPDFIPAAGENPFGMNPNFLSPFYMWEDKSNFGAPFIGQHSIYIYHIIWPVLRLFSSVIHPTILFIFLGYFLSSLFFYLMLKSLVKVGNDYWYLPPAMLYSFNIYRLLIGSIEQTMFFIFMPLIFLCYLKFTENVKFKYVCMLVLLSNISNAMSFNLAIFFIPYILIFSYFCYQLIYKIYRKLSIRKFLVYNLVLLMIVIASHLFWLVPMVGMFINKYSIVGPKAVAISTWNALAVGNFFDHFRYLGFWAFRLGYGFGLYYPISVNYFKPLLIASTFFIAIFSYVYLLFLRKSSSNKKFLIYILTSTIISYLLVAGTKSIVFGSIYNFLYDNLSIVKIYREPYAKFMPLYIFFTSIGLFFSIYYVLSKFKNKYYGLVLIPTLFIVIILNDYNLFIHKYFTRKAKNIYARSGITKIPDYWINLNEYLNQKKLEERIFITQKNSYINSIYNWEYGVNVSTDMANALMDKPSIKDTYNNFNGVITNIFSNEKVDLKKYLGFISVKSILQENDLEWRISTDNINSPSKTELLIKAHGFEKETGFGIFTKEYLTKILIRTEDEVLNKSFFDELQDKSALALYKTSDEYFLPQFYTPKNIEFIIPNNKLVPEIISKPETPLRTVVYFNSQKPEEISTRINPFLSDDLPTLEFKRINPTKFRIIVHKADNTFPLVFNQNFNDGWKLYLVKKKKTEIKNVSLDNYKISKDDRQNQASRKEVESFLEKGVISSLYNSTDKKPTIDFISKNYQDTIQNNNLKNGNAWETLFIKPLEEKEHLMANGFANSWIVDPGALCNPGSEVSASKCIKNNDGTYEMEIIVEFSHQRLLIVGLTINATVIAFSIFYFLIERLILLLKKRHKTNNER